MALKKTVPAPTGQALSSADERLDQAGQVVRNSAGAPRAGVLPHSTAAFVTARASMGVDVGLFYAALVRGGGVLFIMNDGTVTVPIGAAPGANSQYKVVYVKQNESESPFNDANNLPVLDYVQSTASATPDLAAAIALVPAGGLPLYSVLVPSTATTTQSAGVVITPIFASTAMAGGTVQVRNSTERDQWTAGDSALVIQMDTQITYRRVGGVWRPTTFMQSARGNTVAVDSSVLFTLITMNLPADAPAGRYLVMFDVTTGAGSTGQHYHRVTWAGTEITAYTFDYLNAVPPGGDVAKSDTIPVTHAGGAVTVVLQVQINGSSAASRASRLTVLYVGP